MNWDNPWTWLLVGYGLGSLIVFVVGHFENGRNRSCGKPCHAGVDIVGYAVVWPLVLASFLLEFAGWCWGLGASKDKGTALYDAARLRAAKLHQAKQRQANMRQQRKHEARMDELGAELLSQLQAAGTDQWQERPRRPHAAPVRCARASESEEGRIGVTDGKSEGYFYTIEPPEGFVPDGPVDRVRLVQPGWLPHDG